MFRSVEVRDPDRRCRHCKYSLDGLAGGGGLKCPECGNVVSDDDLLGVRRVPAMATAVLLGCVVPLMTVVAMVLVGVLGGFVGSSGSKGVFLAGAFAFIGALLTVASATVVAIVYVATISRAHRVLHRHLWRRFGAVMAGHLLIGMVLGLCAYRVMVFVASF